MDQRVWRIGVDEAGYGPNLGPLAVAATAWRVSAGAAALADLYGPLADAVRGAAEPPDARLLIADSKSVYKPGGGLAGLELAVLAACAGSTSWSALVDRLGADPAGARMRLPWHAGFDVPLPIDAAPTAIDDASQALARACRRSGIEPPRLAARLVSPAELNALLREHGTKGAALSWVSIGLARRVVDSLPEGDRADLVFDKHGGRNRYGALLQEHFPESWVETLHESRAQSRYRAGDRLTACFRTRGEAELPVALASMTAKLLRELAMRALNAFWSMRVAGLRPTAGYPVDARRFKLEIAAAQAELGVDDADLWRQR